MHGGSVQQRAVPSSYLGNRRKSSIARKEAVSATPSASVPASPRRPSLRPARGSTGVVKSSGGTAAASRGQREATDKLGPAATEKEETKRRDASTKASSPGTPRTSTTSGSSAQANAVETAMQRRGMVTPDNSPQLGRKSITPAVTSTTSRTTTPPSARRSSSAVSAPISKATASADAPSMRACALRKCQGRKGCVCKPPSAVSGPDTTPVDAPDNADMIRPVVQDPESNHATSSLPSPDPTRAGTSDISVATCSSTLADESSHSDAGQLEAAETDGGVVDPTSGSHSFTVEKETSITTTPTEG